MKLLWLFLTTLSAFAQQPALHIDLSGNWQLRDAADKRDLGLYHLPRQTLLPLNTMYWLHRTVAIPDWADTSQLALTLGVFADAYEVYIDEQLVARSSEFRMRDLRIARPLTFPIPPGVVKPGSSMKLSLRLWRVRGAQRRYPEINLPDSGPYLITYLHNKPQHIEDATWRARETAILVGLLSATLGLGLVALLLTGWREPSHRTERLLLATYLLCEELARVGDAVLVFQDAALYPGRYLNLFLTVGAAALLLLATIFAGLRQWWVWAIALIPVVDHLIAELFQRQRQTWLPLGGANTYILIAAISLFAVSRQFRARRTLWHRDVPPMVLLALLGAASTIRAGASANAISIYIGIYRLQLMEVSGLLLAAALTWLLMRDLNQDRARLRSEVESAQSVQSLLFSQHLPQGVEAVYYPASEVGGDFYQAYDTPEGTLVIAGDVSGKGLQAAMRVAVIIGALRARRSNDPAQVLAHLNAALAGSPGFTTCCAALFTSTAVHLANAGHPAPYADGVELNLPADLPLGLADDCQYAGSTHSGQRFTFVSDGVIEAANASGELFGFDRTRAIATKPAKEIAEAARAWGQNDDVTVVTVQRTLTHPVH